MPPPNLGKILLRWCDRCHVPLLAPRCACGCETRAVPLTPPGDARPAFPFDIRRINGIFQEHFGAPLIPDGHIALLNKVPDQDRMEEIVVGGGIAGIIRYLPRERRYEPIPRPEACTLFSPARRYVTVADDAVPFIRDGKMSVLAPGLTFIENSVEEGDEVFILAQDGSCAGVGRAKVGAAAARMMKKGQVVRTRRNTPSVIVPGAADWASAVAANAAVLEETEASSVRFVQEVTAQYPGLSRNVSYSGGKDSLATLLVVMKAIGRVPILFADTGLEFPETYANVEETARRYAIECIRTDGRTRFSETFGREGPPAVNARWCCRVCKLDPVSDLIRERWGECLSFIGQRRYESASRAQSGRVWKNPAVRCQVSAAPIQDWTALHVWLYLMREGAPYNPLYERSLDRIGCYICPSSDLASLHRIEQDYPALWEGWLQQLEAWRESRGLPPEWVREGRWRIREGCTW